MEKIDIYLINGYPWIYCPFVISPVCPVLYSLITIKL